MADLFDHHPQLRQWLQRQANGANDTEDVLDYRPDPAPPPPSLGRRAAAWWLAYGLWVVVPVSLFTVWQLAVTSHTRVHERQERAALRDEVQQIIALAEERGHLERKTGIMRGLRLGMLVTACHVSLEAVAGDLHAWIDRVDALDPETCAALRQTLHEKGMP